ncbi:transcription initiation factor TFIID subunit 3-like [Musca vetustissima]|uniref:transcription initiation factor TFIID subunit 3-like n=1 Tax=Musca vetustissima TaxID=27455 RepID=UPI002AB7A065|nr:transcription initiation factor TFIID subunit 3-like [Musca vetustissima]
MKKLKNKIWQMKSQHEVVQQKIEHLRSSIDGLRTKKKSLINVGKSLKKRASHLGETLVVDRNSSYSGKSTSKTSSGTLSIKRTKKSLRLKSSSERGHSESLQSKKSPVTMASRGKGKKEPIPIGDSKRASTKTRHSKRSRGSKKSSSSTITPSSRSSMAKRRLSTTKNKPKQKYRKRQPKTSSSTSSQALLKPRKTLSKKSPPLDKPIPKNPTANLEDMRRQFKKFKTKGRQINIQRPLDKDTFKSIHLLRKNSNYFQIPRHSTSKPSYSTDADETIPTPTAPPKRKPSVYDDKYFRNLIKTQSQMIRDRIQKDRKQKQHLMEQQKALEAERLKREKEEKERSLKNKRSSSYGERELERLVRSAMKSQYKMTEVIPGETPIINEDILKMSDKGKRIDIRDLVPTSKIFEWPQPREERPPLKSQPSIRKSKHRRTSMKRTKKRLRNSQDSNESKEELNSEVKVSHFWEYQDPAREEEEFKEDQDAVVEQEMQDLNLIKKKRKPKRRVSFSRRKIIVNPTMEKQKSPTLLVCQPCGMTYLSTETPCCQLKSKRCVDE